MTNAAPFGYLLSIQNFFVPQRFLLYGYPVRPAERSLTRPDGLTSLTGYLNF